MQTIKDDCYFKIGIGLDIINDYLFHDLEETIEIAQAMWNEYLDIETLFVYQYQNYFETAVYIKSRTFDAKRNKN